MHIGVRLSRALQCTVFQVVAYFKVKYIKPGIYWRNRKSGITKLATNVSTSHTLSSSNTYLLLVPTVAPSNLEQSKRQVVGNLVSSVDKDSQHRIVGVLDEEEEKQNILRRKIPTTIEGNRLSNSRLGPTASLHRQKQISSHGSVHSIKPISTVSKDHSNASHKPSQHHCSSTTDISILTENLQHLVPNTDRVYTSTSKHHLHVSYLICFYLIERIL